MALSSKADCPFWQEAKTNEERLREAEAELEQLRNQHAMTVENFNLYAEGRAEERASGVKELAAAEAKLARAADALKRAREHFLRSMDRHSEPVREIDAALAAIEGGGRPHDRAHRPSRPGPAAGGGEVSQTIFVALRKWSASPWREG